MGKEIFDILEIVLQYLVQLIIGYLVVEVNQAVAIACHLDQFVTQFGGYYAQVG